jgi:hypothetical protein
MPHYSDGTLAQVGDIVRGKGYNNKWNVSTRDNWRELVGVVADVRSGDSCTLSVAYIEATELPERLEQWQVSAYRESTFVGSQPNVKALRVQIEYGDTKGFSKI